MLKLHQAVLFVALVAPLQAQAQSSDAARNFTQALYDAYRHGESVYPVAQATTFAPRLLALIRHDQAMTALGEAPDLDWDPICDCQDSDGLKVERIDMADVKPGRKVAIVILRYGGGGASVAVRLDLVSLQGRWRVADIHSKAVPSLVGFLEKAERH